MRCPCTPMPSTERERRRPSGLGREPDSKRGKGEGGRENNCEGG